MGTADIEKVVLLLNLVKEFMFWPLVMILILIFLFVFVGWLEKQG